MALILNIETSADICSIALGNDGKLVSIREDGLKNSHASKAAGFIKEVLQEANLSLSQIDAVAISEGPGSYTGLRIGTSLAKGICYSINKPLIAVSTLQALAYQAVLITQGEAAYYIPMIDARRMEVYTAVFNETNKAIAKSFPTVVDEYFQAQYINEKTTYLFGSGLNKCKHILLHKNSIFLDITINSSKFLLPLSEENYNSINFVNVSLFEPRYLKLFKEII